MPAQTGPPNAGASLKTRHFAHAVSIHGLRKRF